MIKLKTSQEIALLRKACNALSVWMEQCIANLRIGATYQNGLDIELELVQYIDQLTPSLSGLKWWDTPFAYQKNAEGEKFGSPLCISINDEIVHSRPSNKRFETSDIITIDAGLSFRGWCADMARTVIFNTGSWSDNSYLVESCQYALNAGIRQCKPGNKLGDISAAIGKVAEESKLGIILDYMGHGIGRGLHEEPRICNRPGLYSQYDSVIMRPGMVFCLEPMFTNSSNGRATLAPDKWKVWTQDGSMAAHFESQILITKEGCDVLTKLTGECPLEGR